MKSNPPSCLPLISFIARSSSHLARACRRMSEIRANFRLRAPGFLFSETDYYREEMGEPLVRWWGFLHEQANPAKLPAWKNQCRELEDRLRDPNGNRTVNIDPGYLNLGLVVLGSHKPHHQKIYLGQGVYADPVLEFVDGEFQPFHWSFPDFQEPRYYPVLREFRETYKELLRESS